MLGGFLGLMGPVVLMLGILFGAIADGVLELQRIREALEKANSTAKGRPPQAPV